LSDDRRLRGTTLALIAFCAFPVGDAVIKSLAGEWPASAVAALRFSLSAVGLGLLLWFREGPQGFVVHRPWLHAARGLALAGATLFFFNAIFLMPLAEAITIQFVNPVLTALLSAWLLREAPPRSAWLATAFALIGVCVMLRPGFSELGWSALLPLGAACCVSMLMILNRMVSAQRSIWAAQFLVAAWASLFLLLATALGHLAFEPLRIEHGPSLRLVLCCMLVAVTASASHYWLYLATTRATAAEVAPLVYVQLIVATGISIVFFGEGLDLLGAFGALFIVAGGLYLWWADRRPGTVARGSASP
jgi:drug/metabolite transporter (DMT)-like permease